MSILLPPAQKNRKQSNKRTKKIQNITYIGGSLSVFITRALNCLFDDFMLNKKKRWEGQIQWHTTVAEAVAAAAASITTEQHLQN